MKIVDVNILLYAVNRRAPQHRLACSWLEHALSDDEPVGLSWLVLLGFLRVSTSARALATPLTVDEALGTVEAWLGHPNTHLLVETPEHWRILRELLRETGTGGDLTTDAYLAALAISHGATMASFDADFGRFRRLRWENPAG